MTESTPDEESPVRPSTTRVDWPGIAGLWRRPVETAATVDNDDDVSAYDHLSSVDDYIDRRLLDDNVPTFDEYLESCVHDDVDNPAVLDDLRPIIDKFRAEHDIVGRRFDVDHSLDIDDPTNDRPVDYDRAAALFEQFAADYYARRADYGRDPDDSPGRRPCDPPYDDRPTR